MTINQIAIDCLSKEAAPAWIKMLQKGMLSPASVNRVAQSMPVGKFRTVNPVGYGQMNAAERVVGNLGPAGSGEMVRKLPLNPGVDLVKHYQPLVNASQAAEKAMPGATAPYLAATPRGVFQQHAGTSNIIPPGVTPQGWQQTVKSKLEPLGFSDMHPDNFSAGGKLFDFQAGHFGGAAGGSQVFNPMKVMKAHPPYAQAMNQAMKGPTPQLKDQGFERAKAMVPQMPHTFYDKSMKGVPAMKPPTLGQPGTIGSAPGTPGLATKAAIEHLLKGI